MLRKTENFTLDIYKYGENHDKIGSVEYRMPKALADNLLKERKGSDKKMQPQDYLIKYVNEDCHLLRKCDTVTVY